MRLLSEPPAGEHRERQDFRVLGLDRAPAGRRGADGWWDVVPIEHRSIRAPRTPPGSRSSREGGGVIFVGIDWSETHHDACVLDVDGRVLTKGRVPEGIDGVSTLHEMVAAHAEDLSEVVVGIELDRGLLVGALVAAGYTVHAINPLSVDRYRDRHRVSGAKSDPGDARVLADLVRTDRHLHRRVAGDTELAEAVKVLARAHQSLIWTRQRHLNQLRSALREFYPGALQAFGTNLGSSDALAVLGAAPTPAKGRSLTTARIAGILTRGGRRRGAQ